MEMPDTANKRTYTRLEFSPEQEEQLIEFVKANPALFDPKDSHFKNKKYRDRLWNQFGDEIDKKGERFFIFFFIFKCSMKTFLN